MSEPRIFVSIASYRDAECQWTIRDLFEKAAKPERIFVGVCWQFVADEDLDCFQIQTRPEQCRIIEFDARDSLGVCWARAHTQTLYQGEEYTLQIDSHMRFAPSWDEEMITMLAECPSLRALLSCYPPGYIPPDKVETNDNNILYAGSFDEQGMLHLHSHRVAPEKAPESPEPNPFIGAGYLFGPGQIIADVPYDPYLYFLGEEPSMSARLWTAGWNSHAPNRTLIWHDYSPRPSRPRHFYDNKRANELNIKSFMRLRYLLAGEPAADHEALIDIEKFGLGTKRSLAAYEAYAKVDFRRRLINGKSATQIAQEVPPETRRGDHTREFSRIWQNNAWNCPETRSGYGASLSSTASLRPDLADLFAQLGIRSLADAGCGELNWISKISEALNLYLGFDVVPEIAAQGRTRFGARRGHFFATADITLDTLPQCDAILCRDVLTHFPLWKAQDALALFKRSSSRLLIATTFDTPDNAEVKLGGWHPINLQAAPFSLPPPMLMLSEKAPNPAKQLGVWRLDELP